MGPSRRADFQVVHTQLWGLFRGWRRSFRVDSPSTGEMGWGSLPLVLGQTSLVNDLGVLAAASEGYNHLKCLPALQFSDHTMRVCFATVV